MDFDENKLANIAHQLDIDGFWGALEASLTNKVKEEMFALDVEDTGGFQKCATKKELIKDFTSMIRNLINNKL